MSRRKRSSLIIEKADRRAASLKSIGDTLDLGNGLTLEAYVTEIKSLREKLNRYNTLLSSVDEAYNDVIASEKNLADLTERMLVGVAAKYGKNANEYEMAGGKRKTERKKSKPKASPTNIG
jgi:hypothetical protein